MKYLKYITLLIIIGLFVCNKSDGQTIHKTLVATITGIDFGPGVGTISGTYTYHFIYKLNDQGYIESVHWNARDLNLYNDKGEKVKITDSGHDTYGVLWDFFNRPEYYNGGPGAPISYNVTDGWLNGVMPPQFPTEGVFINMSAKIQVKNNKVRVGMIWVVNFNANGDPVVDFIKTF